MAWIDSRAEPYHGFSLDSEQAPLRGLVENAYESQIRRQVQLWVAGGRQGRDPSDREASAEQAPNVVRTFLELIAYLDGRGELSPSEVDSLFHSWLTFIGDRERPELRLYLDMYDYESCSREVNRLLPGHAPSRWQRPDELLECPRLLAVYGSLVPGSQTWPEFLSFCAARDVTGIEDRIHVVGPALITGTLYDTGTYAGIVPGGPRAATKATLVEVKDLDVLAMLDAYEEIDAAAPEASEYAREFWPVVHGGLTVGAWVYVYQWPVSASSVVVDGDWQAHLRARSS